MSDELKPCPFCGGEPRTWEAFGGVWVTCGNARDCALETEVNVATWNTRPIEDALRARIARLERVLAAVDARLASYAWNEGEFCEWLDDYEIEGATLAQVRRVIAAALGGEK